MKYQAKIAFTSTESTYDFGNVCIPLEGQCKNARTSQKKRKRIQKFFFQDYLIIHEYHLCIHLSVTRSVTTVAALHRVESPYRARPSGKWQNEDDEGLCGCTIPMLRTEWVCSTTQETGSARWRERDKKTSTLVNILNFTLYICASVLWQPPKTNMVMEML